MNKDKLREIMEKVSIAIRDFDNIGCDVGKLVKDISAMLGVTQSFYAIPPKPGGYNNA